MNEVVDQDSMRLRNVFLAGGPTNIGFREDTPRVNDRIVALLERILREATLYKKLLACRGDEAQVLLNAFQTLLDLKDAVDPPLRRSLVVAMRRLSKVANLYPSGFELASVDLYNEEPAAGGGYADIYKARFRGVAVCLKAIRLYESRQVDQLIKEYSREAILWRQLSHPNLLPFLGLFRVRSRIAFVSPWAENGHVIDFLKTKPHADRVLLCMDAAAGVSYLHDNDIIHGDLKAVNVLVDSSGRATLADFGLSAVTDPQILHWSSQSSAASKGGTTRWQAPELHEDRSESVIHNTPASDVYAWACVCYEIFTERVPFFEWSRNGAVISRVQRGQRPSQPPRSDSAWTERGLTDRMWNLMKECWEHHPYDRPQVSRILAQLSSERPVDPRPHVHWLETVARFRDRNHPSPAWNAVEGLLSRLLPSNIAPCCEASASSTSANMKNTSNTATRHSSEARGMPKAPIDPTNVFVLTSDNEWASSSLGSADVNPHDTSPSSAFRSVEELVDIPKPERHPVAFRKLFYLPGGGLESDEWCDLSMVLVDNYVVMSRLVRRKNHEVYCRLGQPVPFDLLTLISSAGPPKQLSRLIFLGAAALGRSPYTNDTFSFFPLIFRRDGRRAGEITLYADSVAARDQWRLEWEDLKACCHPNNATSNKPFKVQPLTVDTSFVPTTTTVAEPYYYYDKDRTLAGKVTCSVPLATRDGRRFVAVGCEEGVWIGYKNVGRSMRRVLNLKMVTKLAVLEDSSICLVLANNSLFAYRIQDLASAIVLGPAFTTSNAWQAPHKNITFFNVLDLGSSGIFIVYMCKDGPHETFEMFSLDVDETKERWTIPTEAGYSSSPRLWFRLYREILLPDEVVDIIPMYGRIAILFASNIIGITDHDMSDLAIIPMHRHVQPSSEPRFRASRPIGLIASRPNELLACYDDFGVFISIQGTHSVTTVEWEGVAERVAFHHPYLLVFNNCFIEIRHMLERARLVQIIKGSDIRCVWDGQGVCNNAAPLPGFDAEARIHAVMDNTVKSPPNAKTTGGPATQTVVEVIMNNPSSSPYGIPVLRSSPVANHPHS